MVSVQAKGNELEVKLIVPIFRILSRRKKNDNQTKREGNVEEMKMSQKYYIQWINWVYKLYRLFFLIVLFQSLTTRVSHHRRSLENHGSTIARVKSNFAWRRYKRRPLLSTPWTKLNRSHSCWNCPGLTSKEDTWCMNKRENVSSM